MEKKKTEVSEKSVLDKELTNQCGLQSHVWEFFLRFYLRFASKVEIAPIDQL